MQALHTNLSGAVQVYPESRAGSAHDAIPRIGSAGTEVGTAAGDRAGGARRHKQFHLYVQILSDIRAVNRAQRTIVLAADEHHASKVLAGIPDRGRWIARQPFADLDVVPKDRREVVRFTALHVQV